MTCRKRGNLGLEPVCCTTCNRYYHSTQRWISPNLPCYAPSSSSFAWQPHWRTWVVVALMFALNTSTSYWPSKVLASLSDPPQWYHWPGRPSSFVLLCSPSWNGLSSKCCFIFWRKLLWREETLVAQWWRVVNFFLLNIFEIIFVE